MVHETSTSYDDNHIIGIVRNENNMVKISLFDVSNVSAPIKISNYEINGTWSDTPVLTEYKAFLFDRSKDLMAFPGSIQTDNFTWSMWQGIYVFNVTLDKGIVLQGSVTHQVDIVYWNNIDYFGSFYIRKVLYIENVLHGA